MKFKLKSSFTPTGDQPLAIKSLVEGLNNDEKYQTLLGVTGSGKTFTILAKILHILDQNLAKPEEIIVVAYNTSVANDLRDRFEKLAEVFPNLENKIKKVSVAYGKKCPECKKKIDQALHFCEDRNKFIPIFIN